MECKIIYDNDGKEIKRTVGNAVLVQDIKIGGYTAYFKQLPNIIAEGDSSVKSYKIRHYSFFIIPRWPTGSIS